MDVGEDVILTVAVVAGALAAVAEGHVGVVGVRLAADAALVIVPLGGPVIREKRKGEKPKVKG